eukprot:1147769-Pelagomonas_calceolata.AAC.1
MQLEVQGVRYFLGIVLRQMQCTIYFMFGGHLKHANAQELPDFVPLGRISSKAKDQGREAGSRQGAAGEGDPPGQGPQVPHQGQGQATRGSRREAGKRRYAGVMGLVELGIGAYACAQVGHSGGWQVSDAGAIGPAAFGLSKALKGLQRLWHLLLGFMMQGSILSSTILHGRNAFAPKMFFVPGPSVYRRSSKLASNMLCTRTSNLQSSNMLLISAMLQKNRDYWKRRSCSNCFSNNHATFMCSSMLARIAMKYRVQQPED